MGGDAAESAGARAARLERQLTALIQVSRRWRHYEGDVDRAVQMVTEAAALALAVERASVWIYRDRRETIFCADLFEATPKRHSHGQELHKKDFPVYFETMEAAEVIAAHNARTDPRTIEFTAKYLVPNDIHAMLDAPIRIGTRCIGFLCLESVGETRNFTEDEINTAIYLADLVGATHEVSRRIDSERQARQSISMLRATFEATGAGVLALDRAGHIIDNNGRAMDIWKLPPEFLGSRADPRALMHYMASRTDDPEHFVTRTKAVVAHPDADSHDVITLDDGRILECVSQPQELDGEIIGRVWSFRDITHQYRVEEELRDLSLHDPLTGLLNRRAVDSILDKEIMRARRSKQPLCVAMVDIDHFKAVNDTHGHPVGDEVLRQLADELDGRLRATDHTARWGGEEFLVILPDTDLTGALVVLDEVRAYIDRKRADIPSFTVSVGIAQLESDETAAELVHQADRKLYEAKAEGRNCVKM